MELLVKAVQTASGPAAWRRGHVVLARPDGHQWGTAEALPRFFVVTVPDAFVGAHPELFVDDRDADGETLRRRGWMLDVDALPPGILTAMETSGRASLSTQVAGDILQRDLRTNAAPEFATIRDLVKARGGRR